MAQKWFLDLDGVRSGPYQTPEVLGLVAEGEVLPHHRISSSLKDQPWITVLEWRLEQAKLSSPTEKKSYIPDSKPTPPAATDPKKNPHEIPWNDLREKSTPPAAPATNEVGAVDLNPEATPDEIEEVIQVLNAPEKAQPPAEVPPAIEISPAAPILEPVNKAATVVLEPIHKEPATKRDPMAEMYDMLQNTKQKREAKEKEKASHQYRHHHSSPAHEKDHKASSKKSSNSSVMRTVVIGLLIMIPGFLLGQLFQQSSTPPPQPVATEKNLTAPAKVEPKYEVVDRSTDKITIKGRVEKPVVNNNNATPMSPKSMVQTINKSVPAQAAHPMNEKDAQELKDLKKELLELKALKEEMRNSDNRNNGGGDEIRTDEDYLNPPDGDIGGGAAYEGDDYDAPPGKYPNPYKPAQNPNQPAVNY
ncbi:MAG: hypothetical protein JST80_10700 [Bdellovibrionales bacterium]|nr:hypothetical protein [Bdellovibrionales bacterium]